MSAPAGWYPDPELVNTRRYWDGERWTAHRQETPAPAPAREIVGRTPSYQLLEREGRNGNGWTDWGYIFAVLLPLLGFIVGLSQIGRSPRHAWQIIGLSLAAVVVYAVLFAWLG